MEDENPVRGAGRGSSRGEDPFLESGSGGAAPGPGTSGERSLFSLEQYDAIYPPGIETYYWHRARNRILLREVRRQWTAVGGGRVLEIGCGRGVVVRALRAGGIACEGVELAPVEVPADLVGEVRTGRDVFDLTPEERRGVKVILLLDVLEHLSEPESFLQNCAGFFPDLERIVITVPARSELWTEFDAFCGHHLRYDREGLCQLLDRAGLEGKPRYLFHALYWPGRLLGERSRPRDLHYSPPKVRWLHRLIAWILDWDDRLLPGRWRGSSLLVSARRKLS